MSRLSLELVRLIPQERAAPVEMKLTGMGRRLLLVAVGFFVSIAGTVGAQPEPSVGAAGVAPVVVGGEQLPPLASALYLLPPVADPVKQLPADRDGALTGYLRLEVCDWDIEECTVHDDITLHKSRYHAKWNPAEADLGTEFEVRLYVLDLLIGSFLYTPTEHQTIMVRFIVEKHPVIRARVLRERGFTADAIARLLAEDFGLEPNAVAEVLHGQGYPAVEIYAALAAVFEMGYWDIELVLQRIGIDPEAYLDVTALDWVKQFSPVLMFDRAYKGLPMSAQTYFASGLFNEVCEESTITWNTDWTPSCDATAGVTQQCGRDECTCGMQNNDFSQLQSGRVPTYFRVISDVAEPDGVGRLRIAYWWFYGFQPCCNCVKASVSKDGAHHGDWEHIVVTTNPERTDIDYVTYFAHGLSYTRHAGSFPTKGVSGRPAVFVGKTAHGSYHSKKNSGYMAGTPHYCCDFADYRNPVAGSIWWNTNSNLVSLHGFAEPWMRADRIGEVYWPENLWIKQWRWGPHISYCAFGGDLCSSWKHTMAVGTHPTKVDLTWDMPSCTQLGCKRNRFCKGNVYWDGANNFNQGWPWDD